MKKSLLLLALSAMVIGGCSKSEIDDGSINSTNAISFSTSSNKQTKATVLDNTFEDGDAFGVFAYYTGQENWATANSSDNDSSDNDSPEPNFMYNQQVVYDGAWTYTPMKYWPNSDGEMISFFGYMPYSDETEASVSASGLPQIIFTQDMNAEDMLDLTVAQALDEEKRTSAVVLPFEHILTRMNFSAQVDHKLPDDGVTAATSVYITGLKVLGSTNNTASKLYSEATYTMADGTDANGNGTWDYTTSAPTVATADLEVDENTILNTADYSLGSPVQTVSGVKLAQDGTATSLLEDGEYLFLIPPSAEGVTAEDDIQIEVSYSVVTIDATVDGGLAKADATAVMSMPNGTLMSEVAYNVVLTIGVDEVLLDAEAINGWPTEETVYTEYDAATADAVESSLTDAFEAGQDDVTVTYESADPAAELAITIPTATDSPNMAITLDLTDQEGDVSITTDAAYTGKLYINAPDATVTINGASYTNLTAWTADQTLIIAKGTTVNGLTINGGNVVVYGTLKGNIVKSLTNSDETTTITVMTGDVCVEDDNTTIGDGITLNAYPTEDGCYYSLDGGAWKKIVWTSENGLNEWTLAGETGYEKIKVITIGDCNGYDNAANIINRAYRNPNIKEIDLSGMSTITSSSTDKLADIMVYYDESEIADGSLEVARSLEKIIFPPCTKSIGSNFLKIQPNLKEVILNEGLDEISGGLFKELQNLKSINLPSTLEVIGENTFYQCAIDFSDSFKFPAGLTEIGANAFRGTNLRGDITLSVTLETLGDYAFLDTNITSINIPEKITYIPTHLFFETETIRTITGLDNEKLVDLRRAAFFVAGFEELYIPKNIDLNSNDNDTDVVGDDGFRFCKMPNLKKIEFEGGGTDFTLRIKDIYGNPVLEEVIFPSNLIGFTDNTLAGCPMLSTITCKATTLPTATATDFGYIDVDGSNLYVGRDVTGDKILYVPADLVASYNAITTDGTDEIVEEFDVDGNITSTNENYWKTVLQDECHFVVKSIEDMPAE